jgi:hypothetical protein
MVPVIIIAVAFTGLAAVVFWAAPRGKLAPLSNALMSQKRGTSFGINATIAVVIVVFGLVVPAVFLIQNHDNGATAGITDHIKLTSAEVQGRYLFGEHCAVCHTLAAASAVGKTGPNLDTLRPTMYTLRKTIKNGCLQDPGPSQSLQKCLGYGTMPADVVQGPEATDVEQFVHAVAGHGDGT